MKSTMFIFSSVFLLLGSMASLEANDNCKCRRIRRAKRCVIAQPCATPPACTPQATIQCAPTCAPQATTQCAPTCAPQATTQCVPTCTPQATTQYAPAFTPIVTNQYMPNNYSSGIADSAVWGSQVGMMAQPGMTPSYTSMKPRLTTGTPEEREGILEEVQVYLDNNNTDICGLKGKVPGYGPFVQMLKDTGNKAQFCFPSKDAWVRSADIRAQTIQLLTSAGVIQPMAEPAAVQAMPESIAVAPEPVLGSPLEATVTSGAAMSSHADVLSKITAYLTENDIEICDLRSAIPAYGKIIDKLDQNEKYKPEVGAPRICYPSVEIWDADAKGVKTEIMSVLKANNIL